MTVPTARPSIAQLREFVITPQGHEALTSAPTCRCAYEVSMGMFICTKCGTGVQPEQQTYLGSRDKS